MRIVYDTLLLLHVLAVIVWVGGMFVLHFTVRPTMTELLEPPQRVPVLVRVLQRFLAWAGLSAGVAVASGAAMLAVGGGMRAAHGSVHLMLATGLVMTAIYAWVRLALLPPAVQAAAARDWPRAAVALAAVRRWVGINLVLGVVTVAIATLGRSVL